MLPALMLSLDGLNMAKMWPKFPEFQSKLSAAAAGIFVWAWAGEGTGPPISGGAYAGLNLWLGPKTQPNATRAWANIGAKIRAGQGQSLPALGSETPPPRDEVRADTVQADSRTDPRGPAGHSEAEDGEMPTSLEEAHAMIRSLRARCAS